MRLDWLSLLRVLNHHITSTSCSSFRELTVSAPPTNPEVHCVVFSQLLAHKQLQRYFPTLFSATSDENMSTNLPGGNMNMESQLLSIMNVLVKAAVTEIIQLFSESSETLRLHLTQSLKENENLRVRMKVMRSELFSLKLQTRTNRPASRFSSFKGNIPKPRAKPQGKDTFK